MITDLPRPGLRSDLAPLVGAYDELVSDIPVGSPPVPPGRHAAPGGWYPDPVDPGQERYWDGWQWSRNTRPREGMRQQDFAPPQQPYANPYPPAPYQPGYPAAGIGAGVRASTTADGVPLAGWWWRVLAALIDVLFTSIVVSLLTFPIYRSMVAQFTQILREMLASQGSGTTLPPNINDLVSFRDQMITVAVTLAVGAVYHGLFLRWKAATPGKLICRLRVVPVDRGQNREPLSWNVIVVRVAIWVLPGMNGLLGVVQLIDALFPLWQPKRQALHDLAAKTQVVRLG